VLGSTELSDESKTVFESHIVADSQLKIMYHKITLTVTTSDNKVITFTVSPTEKVSHIKAIISQKGGITLDRFHLQNGEGKDLDDSKTLIQEGINEGSTIIIIYYKTTVTITISTPQGKTIVVTVDLYDTINTVKERIKENENIDRDKYVLKSGDDEIDDGKTIKALIDEHKSIIMVYKTFKITIVGKQKIFTMSVYYADTIATIKERIHKIDGTPLERTELKFGNKVLKNSKSVTALGLKEGSTLKLVYTTIKISVNVPAGPEGGQKTIEF
jgi:hypothetical protein